MTVVITCACNGRSKRLAKFEALNLTPSVGTQDAAAQTRQARVSGDFTFTSRLQHDQNVVKHGQPKADRLWILPYRIVIGGFVNCVCRFNFSPFP